MVRTFGSSRTRDFSETNSLYSLWLARPVLEQGFVVMNCDVLFHPAMLVDLLTARHENALLVAYPEHDDPEMGDEEMKVRVRRGRVVDIDKNLPRRANRRRERRHREVQCRRRAPADLGDGRTG